MWSKRKYSEFYKLKLKNLLKYRKKRGRKRYNDCTCSVCEGVRKSIKYLRSNRLPAVPDWLVCYWSDITLDLLYKYKIK